MDRDYIMNFEANERDFDDKADSLFYDTAVNSINLILYTDGFPFDNAIKRLFGNQLEI